MSYKDAVAQITKKVLHREQGIPDRRLMHPAREWSVIMVVALIICASGGVYAFYIFTSYSGISVESEAVEVDQLHYQRSDAHAAIELFEARAAAYNELLIEADAYVVPEPVNEEAEDITLATSSETVTEGLAGLGADPETSVSNVIDAVGE